MLAMATRWSPLLLFCFTACAASAPAPRAPAPWPPGAKEAVARGDFDEASRNASRLEARGEQATALAIRVAIAAHAHDADAMRAALRHPGLTRLREQPSERARLGMALATTLGLGEARADLDAVCQSASLPPSSKERVDACSLAALGAVANGRTASFSGAPSVELDLLPKVPIPIVMLSVNGLPPEPFIIDTGAAGIALSKTYCDRVGIPYLKDAGRITHNGGAEVPLFPAWIDRLDAKGMQVANLDAVVIALPPNLKIGGIVAPHRAFAGTLVELDLRGDKLRVRRDLSDDAWASALGEPAQRVPLTWDDGNMLVPTRLDDRVRGFFNFDTGAVESTVTLETATKLGHAVEQAQAVDSVSIARLRSFPPFDATIGLGQGAAESARLVPIEPAERRSGNDGSVLQRLGNIGIPWMKGRRLAISPNGRTLLYTERTR